jgi:hypothetical protein
VLQVSGQRGQLANLHEHLSELEVRRGLLPPLRSRRVGMSGTAPPHCAREGLSLRASACVLTCQLLVQCSCARARSTCHRTAYHTYAPSCEYLSTPSRCRVTSQVRTTTAPVGLPNARDLLAEPKGHGSYDVRCANSPRC